MIHGSYVYSHLETLAASGFQENLKNFEQHLSYTQTLFFILNLVNNLFKKLEVIAG